MTDFAQVIEQLKVNSKEEDVRDSRRLNQATSHNQDQEARFAGLADAIYETGQRNQDAIDNTGVQTQTTIEDEANEKKKEKPSWLGGFSDSIMSGFGLLNKDSASQEEEKTKDQQSFFKMIGDKIVGGFKSFKDSTKDFVVDKGKDVLGFLKKAALIGLLLMLPKILNSETARNIVKFIETDVIPFFGRVNDFLVDTFGENAPFVVGLLGLGALFAPRLVLAPLKLAFNGIGAVLGGIASGLNAIGTGKEAGAGGMGKKVGKIAKGALRFAGRLTLISAAAFAVFDGVKAGLDEAAKETATIGSTAKAVVAGVVSGLTFGLVEQETIIKGMDTLGEKAVASFEFVKSGFNTGIEKLKQVEIPTMDEVGDAITNTGIAIKDGFIGAKDKLTESKNMLIGSFESIAGVELPNYDDVTSRLKEFSNNLKERVMSIIPSKEKIKDFGIGVKDFVVRQFKDTDEKGDKFERAVQEALKLHYETDHRSDKMDDRALSGLDSYQMAGGNAPSVVPLVTDNSQKVAYNSYNSYAKSISSNNGMANGILDAE